MRLPNGYGCVKKLSGKRRRPYRAMITTRWDITIDGRAKQIQETIGYFETKREALEALAEYNRAPYNISARKITFSQAYEKAVVPKFDSLAKNTVDTYKSAYSNSAALYDVRMVDIRKVHYQDVIDSKSDFSVSTQSNLIKLFHAIDKWALENDIIQKGYSSFVTVTSKKSASARKPFSSEEVYKLWEHADDIRIYGIIIMIYTGLRVNEMLGLRLDQIHLDERYLDVQGTKNKTSVRLVPIHNDIVEILKLLMDNKSNYLFEHNGMKMTYHHYSKYVFLPALEMLNMEHTPHECRHTFATFAKSCRLDSFLIKRIMGHTSQDITEDVYTHTILEDLIMEIDKFTI